MRAKLSRNYPNAFFTTQAGAVLKHGEGYTEVNENDPEVTNALASGFITPECLEDETDLHIIRDISSDKTMKEIVSSNNSAHMKATVEGLKKVPLQSEEAKEEKDAKTSNDKKDII